MMDILPGAARLLVDVRQTVLTPVDLSGDEHESIDRRGIFPIWPDLPEPVAFDVYPLEEITAEKLRCVM